MKRACLVLLPALVVASFIGIYLYLLGGGWNEKANGRGHVFTLTPPALAQSSATFLEEEAGISLYVNVGGSINLATAKTVFRTVEKETSDYVVGSVPLPGLSENEDVHCFVHKDGWIVVYYLKGEPLSKIVDWNLWSGGKMTKNKLQVGLEQITNALGIVVTSVNYYHFQYRYANKCMLILETLTGSGEDSFKVTIPNDLTVYERSWSHYAQTTYWYSSYFKIDGNTINGISGYDYPITKYGTLTFAQLTPGVVHIVSVSGGTSNKLYGVCIGLVYQEP
ncbi:MAG: hypothetical protein QXR42_08630 [Candidatus Bathyarchaeia archaeon]